MRKIASFCVAAALVISGIAAGAESSEVSELRKEVEALSQRIEKMDQSRTLFDGGSSWMDRYTLSGDFNYRTERTNIEPADQKEQIRIRQRINLHLNLDAVVNDEITFHAQFVTGGETPQSTNEDLGDSFDTDPLNLDRAYMTYKPEYFKDNDVTLQLGKMKNPFFKPGNTEMIWDGDVNLEGGSASMKFEYEKAKFFLNTGGFWAIENANDADVGLWAIQGGVSYPVTEDVELLLGVTGYYYANEEGEGPINKAGGNTISNGVYDTEYNILEVFGECHFALNEIPFNVYFDFANNGDPSDEDTAWLFGFTVNKLEKQWDWRFNYNYRQIEMDAVVGGLTDGDFLNGQTNGQMHEFGFKWRVLKNTDVGINYFVGEAFTADDEDDGTDDADYDRFQFDIGVKF